MSTIHFIPAPDTSIPSNPLFSTLMGGTPEWSAETLDFCADNFWLLADLFDNNNSSYTVLQNINARNTTWRQSEIVALAIEAVSKVLRPMDAS
ncbi:MAG: hypothetical protein H6974_16180 [Gammaproteobacteria bacterium]|jgi:hypothetical protein|nr:hypothetical protein [Gammaproteobacteria bacterium]